jgi:hypothetical protein
MSCWEVEVYGFVIGRTQSINEANSCQQISWVVWQIGPQLRAAQAARIVTGLAFYEHQKPRERVAGLMGLHLPGVGLPVVPQSRQIQ